MIPQFGFLFKATLKENIDPENKFNSYHIEALAQSTGIDLVILNRKGVENNKIQKSFESKEINQIEYEKAAAVSI